MNKTLKNIPRFVFFFRFQSILVGQKLLHIELPHNSFLQFPQKIVIFRKIV